MKKFKMMIAATALSLVCLSGAAFAYLTAETEVETKAFTAGKLTALLSGVEGDVSEVLYPAATVSSAPVVTNTGNVPALAFVEVKAPYESVSVVDGTGAITEPAQQALFTISDLDAENWVELTSDSGVSGTDSYTYVLGCLTVLNGSETATEEAFSQLQYANIAGATAGTDYEIDVVARLIQAEGLSEGTTVDAGVLHDAYQKLPAAQS